MLCCSVTSLISRCQKSKEACCVSGTAHNTHIGVFQVARRASSYLDDHLAPETLPTPLTAKKLLGMAAEISARL